MIIENASFSGVYTPEEIQSLELDIVDNDSDKFVVIESTDCHTMSVELLMKHGYLLDLVRWALKYEHTSRIILGEKLPSMTITSESLSLGIGKYAY